MVLVMDYSTMLHLEETILEAKRWHGGGGGGGCKFAIALFPDLVVSGPLFMLFKYTIQN